jgi:hypothetical protein
MLSNLVSKTVQTGQSVVLQTDGNLIEYLGGQTVLLTAWDAITLTAAGIVA